MEDPPKKWFRLAPGREIRLRYACLIRCVDVVKDPNSGEIVELHCTWDPDSRGGNAPDGRKVRGTSHWVSARHAVPADVRLYDRLFCKENPLEDEDEGGEFLKHLNPDALKLLTSCRAEPSLAGAAPGRRVQFERLGYFCVDGSSTADKLVFNRTITLKDTWAKIKKKG
jgi:glutaminyl-tRNA synthetase